MYRIFNNDKIKPMLQNMVMFDFDKHYTPKNRIICHLALWSMYMLFLYFAYRYENHQLPFSAFLLTLRVILLNTVFYYLMFNLSIPLFSRFKFGWLWVILSFFLAIEIWIVLNIVIYKLYHHAGYSIQEGVHKGIIEEGATLNYMKEVSLNSIKGKFFLILSFVSPLLFIKILFDAIRLFSKTVRIQEQKLALEIENINIEKDFLKAQLNPHFLFNTLNNLYGLTVKKDDRAPEVVLNISDMMAYTLYESNADSVPLAKEMEFVRNYFALEKMRYPAHTPIQLHITGEASMDHLHIAPLLTFTFIENAFKYGLKSDKPFLHIDIQITETDFQCTIKNDMEESTHTTKFSKQFGGIGLDNTHKRLHLLYPNKHQLVEESLNNFYNVSLRIELS